MPDETRGGSLRTGLPATALVGALVLVGCGDQGSSSEPEAVEPDGVQVSGQLLVDDLFSVRIGDRDGQPCSVSRDIGTDLSVGSQSFVVASPSGEEVALGEVVGTEVQEVDDNGVPTAVPGVCRVLFEAEIGDPAEGVYTLAVPDLELEQRFTADDAGDVRLEIRP